MVEDSLPADLSAIALAKEEALAKAGRLAPAIRNHQSKIINFRCLPQSRIALSVSLSA